MDKFLTLVVALRMVEFNARIVQGLSKECSVAHTFLHCDSILPHLKREWGALHRKLGEASPGNSEKAVEALKERLKDEKFIDFLERTGVNKTQISDMWKFFK